MNTVLYGGTTPLSVIPLSVIKCHKHCTVNTGHIL